MKLLRSALVSLCIAPLLATPSAHAQFSAYGTVAVAAFGFTGTNDANSSDVSFKAATGSLIGGAFYTFPSSSRFKAGLDGRITYSPGYNGGNAYTGALRVGFVPNHNRLRPYFQIGGGVASSQLHETVCGLGCFTRTVRITNGVAQLDVGLDVRVTPHIDIRAFDYGADAAGSGDSFNTATAFFDAGVVYHFHR